MKIRILSLIALAAFAGLSSEARAGIDLGSAGNFAVLAGSSVTNTGPSLINGGDVGVSLGSSITGFTSGTIVTPYTMHANDLAATQAQSDLTSSYNAVAALTPTQDLTGQDLGGLVLTPGIYHFATSAQLTGTLTLDDLGQANAQFVFQVGSTLTTSSLSNVVMINGGPLSASRVFWQVGSSATLGIGSSFNGHILAMTSITLMTGANILDGSALARNGAVTLDSNGILNGQTAVPEPGSMQLAAIGGLSLGLATLAKKTRQIPITS